MSLQQFLKRLAPCVRYLSGVMIFTVFMLNPNPGWCEYKSMEDRMISLLKYSAGIFSAFMIHEGAHLVAAKATGTNIDWEMGNYNQPLAYTEQADNDTDGFILSSAGLTTQAVASEIILQVDSIDKNNDFVRGMMHWNVLNPILYALDYWFINRTNKKTANGYQGDIQGIEYYSDEKTANMFAASIVAVAGIQGYRFLKTQDWAPDWVKDEAQNLNFAPVKSGGFSFSYTINF